MYWEEETLDDLINNVLAELINRPFNLEATRGTTSEIIGVLLHLKNPLARLSRTETKGKIFSALGELLWYLSKTNELEFISYYLSKYQNETEDGKTVYGGYGPRFFNLRNQHDQIENVLALLRKKDSSRKAVIQLFDGEDIATDHKEIPCTCTIQFLIRDGHLHMFTSMRSNDAYMGLSHDVFAFTMMQEIIARELDVDLGSYYHSVGSMHLYDYDEAKAKKYLNEGFQSTKNRMPEMPKGSQWDSISKILEVESKLRKSEKIEMSNYELTPYWADIARLLQVFSLSKMKNMDGIHDILQEMSNPIYNTYMEKWTSNSHE